MPHTRLGLPPVDEDLQAAIQEAQTFELTLMNAPVPQSPLSTHEIDKLLAEAEQYGIDLSLLIHNLQLSPTERLEKLQGAVELILELRQKKPSGNIEPPPNDPTF